MKKAGFVLLKINAIISFIVGGYLGFSSFGNNYTAYQNEMMKPMLMVLAGIYIALAILSIVVKSSGSKQLLISILVLSILSLSVVGIVGSSLLLYLVSKGEEIVQETVVEEPNSIDINTPNEVKEVVVKNRPKEAKRPSKSFFILNSFLGVGIAGFILIMVGIFAIFASIGSDEEELKTLGTVALVILIYFALSPANIVLSFVAMKKHTRETYIACVVISSLCLGILGIIGSAIGINNINKFEEENNISTD